ncbi:LysR family transcriptional regulator [Falsirhodobacter algicola]|uniref:LysR family transcriptional regulator n=1 Tax=Falsirhodobacter algicola TaxID=2692330 RepID=A0A8J8MTD9_9RHOB|nr:LysR family transcriptional regulator [Falsirhodobacter algicola]QUS36362.1 LysR family transcriptional regulator [Falsirhodobacter algicola]
MTAFRAAAFHRTLVKAGASLNVSQPAISRRLKELEQYLGCQLFDRSTKPISLTPDGRELLEALERGFGAIESTLERVRFRTNAPTITVTGPTGFLNYWFMHRLDSFHEAFPRINVKMIDSNANDTAKPGDIDIRFLDPLAAREQGEGGVPVFDESVFAAASPLYLERTGVSTLNVDAADHVFLSVDAGDRWYSWHTFFGQMGAKAYAPARQFEFNSYSLLVNAMLAGHGIGLAWDGLLDSYFQSGALVRLSDTQVSTRRGYYLFLREDADPEAAEVADWILAASEAQRRPRTLAPAGGAQLAPAGPV